ncbi:MAG: hypothetical protein AAF891_06575 [Pseudomonadota bacterium]
MNKITPNDMPAVLAVEDAFVEAEFEKAHSLFSAQPLHSAKLAATANDKDSYANNEGTVQFHLIGQKPPAGSPYSDIMNENADILMNMGGLVHGYMTQKYPTVDSTKLDIATWRNVISHLPMLAPSDAVSKQYKNTIAGTKVSGQFLQMIASAIITEGASLLTDFNSFLGSIGDVVFSVHTKSEKYSAITCTYQSYLIDNGVGGYKDVGKIVVRQIDFAENFMEFKSCCSDTRMVDIVMNYNEFSVLVPTSEFRKGGTFHKQWEGLLNPNATKQFNNANNFFNGGDTPQDDIKPVAS